MRKIKFLTFFSFFFLTLIVAAQTVLPDSLALKLRDAKDDRVRAGALYNIADFYFIRNETDSTREIAGRLKAMGSEGNQVALAYSYSLYGILDDSRSDFDGAIEQYLPAIAIFEKEGNGHELSKIYQDMANAYYSLGTNDKSLEYYLKSLKIREERKDESGIANSYMGISNVYSQMHRNDLALRFAQKSLDIKEKLKDQRSVSWLLNNIGTIYLDLKDTAAALSNYERSISIKKMLGDDYGLATTYNNIGTIHLNKGEFRIALNYYRMSLSIRMKINPEGSFEMGFCYDHIGSVYLDMGQYDSAAFYTAKAIELGENAHSWEMLRTPYLNMARVLGRQQKYDAANEYLFKYIAAKDSTLSSQTNELMTEMAAKYDNEKKEQQIAMQELEISDQKKTNLLSVAVACFAVILVIVALKGYLSKKRANHLLEEKNALIENQKALVEEKNKDITDSIHYAQRIQNAILPSADYQQKILPGSFTLFRPKDIVSGDFYWIEAWGNKVIVAVVDCTGHGVPGAFMTFVAYSLLNEAVLEHGIDKPSAILNEMRRNLNRMLRQKNDAEALRDGMDISVIVLDRTAMSLEYAGAYNPLWMIRNKELKEIKGDKQPIGVFVEGEPKPFSDHLVQLEKNDMIYLFTDGYADQFGGAKGKKFKYRSLQQLLLSVHEKAPEAQKKELGDAFEKWKGNLQQIDDVCILGLRL